MKTPSRKKESTKHVEFRSKNRLAPMPAVFVAFGLCACGGCSTTKQGSQVMVAECQQHLLEINEPLNCCVPMEQHLAVGKPIQKGDLLAFFKDRQLPRCPSGTEYLFPYVAGGRPVCPTHGDLLKSVPDVKVLGPHPIYPPEFKPEQ